MEKYFHRSVSSVSMLEMEKYYNCMPGMTLMSNFPMMHPLTT